MAKLDVVAVLTVKPGSEKIVGAALLTLAANSRKDPGCLAYEVFASDVDGSFVTVEQWESEADLAAHMAAPHLAETFSLAGTHLLGSTVHKLTPLEVTDG